MEALTDTPIRTLSSCLASYQALIDTPTKVGHSAPAWQAIKREQIRLPKQSDTQLLPCKPLLLSFPLSGCKSLMGRSIV